MINTMLGLSPFWTVAVATLVGILAAGRITRLLVDDKLPPIVKFRGWYDAKTGFSDDNPGWGLLMHCPWCMGFWTTLLVGGTAWASNLHTAWWVVCGLFAASYVVSYLVFHDED